ncbi:cytochrome P450 [Xylariomycetidae sp. FL0641]|nr:cytochrome P450 [Xylariomycetidae sp. FL0641]
MLSLEPLTTFTSFQIALGLLCLITIAATARKLRARPGLDYPVFGKYQDPNSRDAIVEGKAKCGDSPFFVRSRMSPNALVLPMSLYAEIQSYPDNVISFKESTKQVIFPRYTGLGAGDDNRYEFQGTIRQDLTRNIGRVLDDVQDETSRAVAVELPDSTEWTQTNIYLKVLRIVAQQSGRVFVGLPLARDDEWINTSIQFTTTVASIRMQAADYHPLLRPFVLPFLPAVKKTRQFRVRAKQLMQPLIANMFSADQQEKGGHDAEAGQGGAFMRWALARTRPEHRSPQRLGDNQLLLTFAAIHTTSMTSTAAVMDLATYPQYIEPLRQEIEQVIAEEGLKENSQGQVLFPKRATAKLKKLDSFLKESLRWSPINHVISNRIVMQDTTLSNGLFLPKGTFLTFPQWAVHFDPNSAVHSAAYNLEAGNPGPEVFDGLRWWRLRGVAGRETRHQTVATGPEALTFGHGPHACPGRFFAVAEVKALLVELLRRYDLRLVADGARVGGEDRRPGDKRFGLDRRSDPHCVVEVRRRA